MIVIATLKLNKYLRILTSVSFVLYSSISYQLLTQAYIVHKVERHKIEAYDDCPHDPDEEV